MVHSAEAVASGQPYYRNGRSALCRALSRPVPPRPALPPTPPTSCEGSCVSSLPPVVQPATHGPPGHDHAALLGPVPVGPAPFAARGSDPWVGGALETPPVVHGHGLGQQQLLPRLLLLLLLLLLLHVVILYEEGAAGLQVWRGLAL